MRYALFDVYEHSFNGRFVVFQRFFATSLNLFGGEEGSEQGMVVKFLLQIEGFICFNDFNAKKGVCKHFVELFHLCIIKEALPLLFSQNTVA